MDHTLTTRDFPLSLAAAIIALGVGVMILVPAVVGPWRLSAIVTAGFAFAAACFLSGNPRLLCLWGLVLAVPMELSKHLSTIVFKGGGEQSVRIEIYDVFVFLLALFLVKDIIAGRIRGPRVPKIIWFWVALMAMGCATVIVGPWRTTAAHELVRMFKVLLFFIVVVNELRTPGRMQQCIVPLATGVVLQSAVAIGQYLRGDLLGVTILGETTADTITALAMTSVTGERIFRPSGLLLHANILGVYLAILLPFLIAAFIVLRTTAVRLFLLATISMGMVALILSRARGPWVAFAISFAVLLIGLMARRGLRGRSLAASAAATVTILALVVVFSEEILTRLFQSRADATVGRAVFLADAQKLIADHWLFGTGLNTYAYEVRPYLSHSLRLYKGWVPPVHNIYALWWADQGIIGLSLHLLMWGGVIWVALRNLQVKNELLYALNVASLGSMAAFAFDGLLSFSLRVNQPQRIWFFVSALIFAIHYFRIGPDSTFPALVTPPAHPGRGESAPRNS